MTLKDAEKAFKELGDTDGEEVLELCYINIIWYNIIR